jgi:hypothetical protein
MLEMEWTPLMVDLQGQTQEETSMSLVMAMEVVGEETWKDFQSGRNFDLH